MQAWLDAIPGWKQDVARRLDALIVEAVPDVHKAVKWNTPFYGVEPGVWFLGMHCVTKYVKVTFFRGIHSTRSRPAPPRPPRPATTTSAKANWTRRSSPRGSSRPTNSPANGSDIEG